MKDFHEECVELAVYDAQDRWKEMEAKGITTRHYSQNKSELLWAVSRAAEVCPKVILEIGSRDGISLYCLSAALKRFTYSPRIVISVDKENLGWGRKGSKENLQWVAEQIRTKNDCCVKLIEGDSQLKNTVSKVQDALGNMQVDVLYIDADHSLAGVVKDFESYSPLVREGGIVFFHDIVWNSNRQDIEVWKFWRDVVQYHAYEAMVVKPNEMGVGLLRISKD